MINSLFIKIIEFVRILFSLFSVLKRDVKEIVVFKNVLKKVDSFKDLTAADVFVNYACKHPKTACIFFGNKTWTYYDVK